MPIRPMFIAILAFVLFACSEGVLHLKLLLDSGAGLRPDAPIVLSGQTVGKVAAVEPDGSGGYVAKLEIDPQFRGEATQDARFAVARDPGVPDQRRVEIKPGKPGSPPLAENAAVRGSIEPEPLFPLGEILRSFTDSLGQLREQVERFRSEMQRLPQSEEAKRLKDEWTRLMEEMKKAQETTEESVKKDLLPKLQRELDDLERQFKDLNTAPPAKPPAI